MAEETGAADGGSGELTAESTGPVQASYMAQAGSSREVFFTRTAYGREMIALERRSPKGQMSIVFA